MSKTKLLNLTCNMSKIKLITQKRADFELFKTVIEIKKSGCHTTLTGLQEIVNIRASLNRGLSESLHIAFPETIPVIRPPPHVYKCI
jgi:hypothetical protein